jgi:hypothetical protein
MASASVRAQRLKLLLNQPFISFQTLSSTQFKFCHIVTMRQNMDGKYTYINTYKACL